MQQNVGSVNMYLGWREYHDLTRHTPESLKLAPHALDWANMPDPFRHYEGVPILDLPADPPVPGLAAAPPDGPAFLSQLLFYSAAISASKRVPSTGVRYALRVNPSSGNLHPTEFHFLTRGLKDWPNGLYHYRPSSHMAEQRALGDFEIPGVSPAPILFILTSIAWREAWKYRDRAYRYCLHDIGHASQALALAAQSMGCDTAAISGFSDDAVAEACRLSPDEWPMLLLELKGPAIPIDGNIRSMPVWYPGQPNALSTKIIPYPSIQAIHNATKRQAALFREPLTAPAAPAQIQFARTRRSALDFIGGARTISLPQLSALLAQATEGFVQIYVYAHRVAGLEPGVYRYSPSSARLEPVRSGDQRIAAAGLSLGQDLAGNACLAISMIGDFERATRAHGDRGYRYVHFEAGALGQRLYLAAEALGLGATGIGAFYDEQVHRYLNIAPDQGQVVYHFAIGYPVPDPRLEA